MIYLITYDKNKTFANYTNLENAIMGFGTWCHAMKNTWLIRANLSSNEIYNRLAPHIDKDDRILVIEVKQNYQGWLDEEIWHWALEQFNKPNYPTYP